MKITVRRNGVFGATVSYFPSGSNKPLLEARTCSTVLAVLRLAGMTIPPKRSDNVLVMQAFPVRTRTFGAVEFGLASTMFPDDSVHMPRMLKDTRLVMDYAGSSPVHDCHNVPVSLEHILAAIHFSATEIDKKRYYRLLYDMGDKLLSTVSPHPTWIDIPGHRFYRWSIWLKEVSCE